MTSKRIMNKKGAIPILSSIGSFFSGLFDGIKSIIDLIPKPIKIILFLLVVLLLGNVLVMSIRYFGIHCNSGNTPVKVTNILTNSKLIQATPDYDDINLYGVTVDKNFVLAAGGECSFEYGSQPDKNRIKFVDNGIILELSSSQYFFVSKCVSCEDKEVYIQSMLDYDNRTDGLTFTWTPTKYCLGNAFTKSDKNLWDKINCDLLDYACQVPEGYYFDSSSNNFLCLENNTACENVTIGNNWDILLQESGAKPLYPSNIDVSDSQNIKRAIGITCDELKPRLTLFGIDVFNYEYWVLGLLIAFIIWVSINLKNL